MGLGVESEPLPGFTLVACVVHLAVNGPADRRNDANVSRSLVTRETTLDVFDEFLYVGIEIVVELHGGDNLLSVGFVWDTDDAGVGHSSVRLEGLFDFLGEDLLSGCIDALATTTEKLNLSVGQDFCEVTRHGVPHTVNLVKRSRRLLGVFVVPQGIAATNHDFAHLIAAGLDVTSLVVDHANHRT